MVRLISYSLTFKCWGSTAVVLLVIFAVITENRNYIIEPWKRNKKAMKKLSFVIVIALNSNCPSIIIRGHYSNSKWELSGWIAQRWELSGGAIVIGENCLGVGSYLGGLSRGDFNLWTNLLKSHKFLFYQNMFSIPWPLPVNNLVHCNLFWNLIDIFKVWFWDCQTFNSRYFMFLRYYWYQTDYSIIGFMSPRILFEY